MAWNRYDSLTVRHYYVLTLSCDAKAGLFKSFDRDEVVDAGNFRHLYRNLYFAYVRTFQIIVQNFKILLNSRLNVFERI